MKLSQRLVICACILMSHLAMQAQPVQLHIKSAVVLTDQADPAFANMTFGSSQTISMTSQRYDQSHRRITRSYLRLNLSAMPKHVVVTNAKLTLYFVGGERGTINLALSPVLESWSDQTLTWNRQPAVSATPTIIPALFSIQFPLQFDITELVNQWIQHPEQNFGIQLKLQDESFDQVRLYYSEDYPTDDYYHPKFEAVVNTTATLRSQAEVNAFTGSVHYGDLIISGPDITNLDSLHNLTHVTGRLRVENNPNLLNIDGLYNFSAVQTVKISSNPRLKSIQGRIINQIYSLKILNNDSLVSIGGYFAGHDMATIEVRDNDQLTSFDGLPDAEFCNVVIIENNPALSGIEALAGLRQVNHLKIVNNPSLAACCTLYGLLTGDEGTKTLDISGNASECTVPRIIAGGCCHPEPCTSLQMMNGLTIHPNPIVEDYLIASFTSDKADVVLIQVINGQQNCILEKSVPSVAGENSIHLDMPSMPKGIYYVRMSTGTNRITKRIVKY